MVNGIVCILAPPGKCVLTLCAAATSGSATMTNEAHSQITLVNLVFVYVENVEANKKFEKVTRGPSSGQHSAR